MERGHAGPDSTRAGSLEVDQRPALASLVLEGTSNLQSQTEEVGSVINVSRKTQWHLHPSGKLFHCFMPAIALKGS